MIKEAEVDFGDAAKLSVPLLTTLGLPIAMGKDYQKVPNPHMKGGEPTSMYKPTVDATNRVRAGEGTMLDHMRQYQHPGQIQNHWMYAPLNKYGPKMRQGISDFSHWLGGQGIGHGTGAGAAIGAGTGFLANSLMAALGKQEWSPLKAMLIGGGIGGVAGGAGAGYRQHYTNKFAAEQEEEEEESSVLPWASSLGLLGLGAGGLAYGMTDQDAADRVRGVAKTYDPQAYSDRSALPEGHTELTYYQKMLSPAAQLKIFGMPVGDALVKLRSNRDLMKRLGTESYTLDTHSKREGAGGRQHYKMFARGPVASYIHQMKAKYHGKDVPAELAGAEGLKYTDWMGRKLEDFVAERAGQRINPYEMSTKFMPHEEQNTLMEDFHKSLSPEEQEFRHSIEDLPEKQYVKQTGNYLPKAEWFLDQRDKLQEAGYTAGGAGAGAATGHLLHDLLRGEDEEGDEKRDWKYWLATLGGGALGGVGANRLTHALRKEGAWRAPGFETSAKSEIQQVVDMIRMAPGLSFNQRAQLMSGVSSLSGMDAAQLKRLIGTTGGAGVGYVVARFLMNKGKSTQVIMALLGGVLGSAVFGGGNKTPRTFTGHRGITGADLSGRRF